MTTKVIITFSQMRDSDLAIRANTIIEKMTGNPNFTAPVPALANITTALDEFQQAIEQGHNGGKDRTVVKQTKRLVLEGLLKKLALYVELNANNDLSVVLNSGFDAWKTPTPGPAVLDKPSNFTLVNGPHPGSMKLTVDSIPGAASYMFEYAPSPITEATIWKNGGGKSRTHIFKNLTSGQQYAFRVAGMRDNDAQPLYSDVISRYVQ